jgi:MFS family permease
MGYFSETVRIEKRGRTAGITFLLSGIIMVLLGMVSDGNIGLQTIILSGWRLFGLVAFLVFLATGNVPVKEQLAKDTLTKPSHYKSLLTQKSFLLYFIPWALFSLITYLSVPLQTTILANSPNMLKEEYLRGIENILIAVSAVGCGFLSDFVGRKRVSILGFALLGIGYSFVGIQPNNPLSWYFYTVFDGVALGILYVIFVVTIWSDLSNGSRSEKYYAVGVLPFFISYLLSLTAGTEISTAIQADSIFSFIAVFLFIAVLPLVYAPETLPDKVMKDRDLKSYVENAQKKAKKETRKVNKKEKPQNIQPEEKTETTENSTEYEDAVKLAEKYY